MEQQMMFSDENGFHHIVDNEVAVLKRRVVRPKHRGGVWGYCMEVAYANRQKMLWGYGPDAQTAIAECHDALLAWKIVMDGINGHGA
jgi:hypothetical protein